MSQAIDRAGRSAIALGFAAVLVVLPYASVASAAAADLPTEMRLAQAAPPPPEAFSADQQIADLQRRLQITAAQQPQFDAFAQVMRQNEAAMDAFLQQNPPNQPRNALDEMRAQTRAAELEAQGLERLLPVFQTLYASLSYQQQRMADQLFAPPPPPGAPPPPGR